MVLHVLRAVFILALVGVAMVFLSQDESTIGAFGTINAHKDLMLLCCIGFSLVIIAIDIFIPRKTLAAVGGLFFGLIVGMVVAFGLSLIVNLIIEAFVPTLRGTETADHPFVSAVKLSIGVVCCYIAISFVMQTKDDVRFVIPYVEFAKQTKGSRPLLLDTSVIIDGRITDVAETGIIEAEMIIPRFVLQELQGIADSADKLKRNRGRRGLDMLNKLQGSEKADIRIMDTPLKSGDPTTVDERLVELGRELNGRVMTNDYNLNKIAQLRGVQVVNINDLSTALRPVYLQGEQLRIKIIKPGEGTGQGVGYLDDGTMVVVEGARDHMGRELAITVTNVLQTSAGRMIFGRAETSEAAPPGRSPSRSGV
ncbi:MAG: PIN/TRAM domain-containing protein [Phycisphaerae bacterium]